MCSNICGLEKVEQVRVCIETECNLKAAIMSVVGWNRADCMFTVLNLFVFPRFPEIYMFGRKWTEGLF